MRPSRLAALLRAAPQAVPFTLRVALLRALLAGDRRAAGVERPVHEGGMAAIKVRCTGIRVPRAVGDVSFCAWSSRSAVLSQKLGDFGTVQLQYMH